MTASSIIVEARRRSGLTIRQLAQRAATSHSAVAAYESGAKVPNPATLDRLVRATGMSLELTLRPGSPFEDRRQRGLEIVEVLDLADAFPSRHGPSIHARFG